MYHFPFLLQQNRPTSRINQRTPYFERSKRPLGSQSTSEDTWNENGSSFIPTNSSYIETGSWFPTGNLKLYKCSYCPYQAKQKSDLKKHLLVHSGEKPHECHICGLRSATRSNIMKHMRSHMRYGPEN